MTSPHIFQLPLARQEFFEGHEGPIAFGINRCGVGFGNPNRIYRYDGYGRLGAGEFTTIAGGTFFGVFRHRMTFLCVPANYVVVTGLIAALTTVAAVQIDCDDVHNDPLGSNR